MDQSLQLEQEHDNLRAALDGFAASGERQRDLQLAGALWKFWYRRGYRVEARQRLEHALAADEFDDSLIGDEGYRTELGSYYGQGGAGFRDWDDSQ